MRRHHRHRQEEEEEEEEEGHIRHKAGLATKPGQEEGTSKGAGAGDINNTIAQIGNTNFKLKFQARRAYRGSFEHLNMTEAYTSLFELLWYSQLPCFDVAKYTSLYRDHRFKNIKCK